MLIAEEVQAIYQTSRGAPCASSPRAAAHHRRRCRARCAPAASGASYYLDAVRLLTGSPHVRMPPRTSGRHAKRATNAPRLCRGQGRWA